jgi:hypothetical protein
MIATEAAARREPEARRGVVAGPGPAGRSGAAVQVGDTDGTAGSVEVGVSGSGSWPWSVSNIGSSDRAGGRVVL